MVRYQFYPHFLLFVQDINQEMPNFRWPSLYHDMSLSKEVINLCPEKPSDWETIDDLLLKKYRDEDAKALKRYVTYVSCTPLIDQSACN